MDYSEVLKALLMNQATHTGGHMEEAYRQGMRPSYVDWGKGIEVVPRWVSNPRTSQQKRSAAQWHGAGFKGQQKSARQLQDTELEQTYRAIEGLYKLGYLGGVKSKNAQGDIKNLERITGNKATGTLLAISALTDLYKSKKPNKKWDYEFDVVGGAPGGKFTYRW